MSFEDKIAIWALKRIGDILVAATPEQRNPQFLGEKLGDTLMESYSNLNDSFWDAFDWFHGYFWGKNAEDLGLTGTFGEIFDLYQDINGNSWFFDWSDINQDRFLNLSTIMVLWVGIIVWAIVFSPVIAAGTTATAGMMLTAGATAGFATWLTSLMLSRQGYDTYEEWVLDMWSQIIVDTATGAIFAWGGLSMLKRFWNLNPNLLIWKQAWLTKEWLIDKWFILWEIGTVGFIISPITSTFVRNVFQPSHSDTDVSDFEE